jgi:hypothetical protein
VTCFSPLPLHIESFYLDRESGRESVIHKAYQQSTIKIFDLRQIIHQILYSNAYRRVFGGRRLDRNERDKINNQVLNDMQNLTKIRMGLGMRNKDVINNSLLNAPCWVEIYFPKLIEFVNELSVQPFINFPPHLRQLSIFGGKPEGILSPEYINEAIELILTEGLLKN